VRRLSSSTAGSLGNLIEQHIKVSSEISGLLRTKANSAFEAKGPLTLAEYVSFCLSHPTLGYYTRQRSDADSQVLGSRGDFTTSPEISQTFGEVCARFCLSANCWV
jgi:SAM-dependent MidA family methyltransferase